MATASPLGSAQYCVMPRCPSSLPFVPPIDQCVIATCMPFGNGSPSSPVQGAAMNLFSKSEPGNLLAIAFTSASLASSPATVSSYQRML